MGITRRLYPDPLLQCAAVKFAGGPAVLCALAAAALALALQISSGMYDERSVALAVLGAGLSLVAALWLRRGAAPEPAFAAQAILGAACAFGVACQFLGNPTFYADQRALQGGFRWFALAALVLLSAYLCVHLRASLVKMRFVLLLACFAVMGIAIIRASPRPWVDVWILQQGASEALRHGIDPYSASYPNIYGNLTGKMYAAELLQNGRLAAYPYPPLTILTDLPGYVLLGDIRYSLLALMLLSAWALARAGASVAAELAALFVLYQPRTFFVLEQAWTEPLVLACFALAVLAIARGRILWAGAAIGLVAASKQGSPYLVVPLAFALPAERRWKSIGVAAAVALAVLVPFAAWDFRGFIRGVIRMQLLQPFRDDSLSLPALFAHLHPGNYGSLVYLSLGLGAIVLVLCLRPRTTLLQAVAAAAAAWFAVLLFYKQPFCNYYWLCVGLLCATVAVRFREAA